MIRYLESKVALETKELFGTPPQFSVSEIKEHQQQSQKEHERQHFQQLEELLKDAVSQPISDSNTAESIPKTSESYLMPEQNADSTEHHFVEVEHAPQEQNHVVFNQEDPLQVHQESLTASVLNEVEQALPAPFNPLESTLGEEAISVRPPVQGEAPQSSIAEETALSHPRNTIEAQQPTVPASFNYGELAQLQQAIQTSGENLQVSDITRDPRVVAQVLIGLLWNVPDPLFTFELYDSFILSQAMVLEKDKVEYVNQLLNSLPKSYATVVNLMLELCTLLLDNAQLNNIDAKYLANILGPAILRPRVYIYYMENDMPVVIQLVEHLIHNRAQQRK